MADINSPGSTIWAPQGVQGPPGPQGPVGPPGPPGPDTAQFAADLASLNSAKGISLVGGGIRAVSNVGVMRTLPKTGAKFVATMYYTDAISGGGGIYWLDLSDTTSAETGYIIVADDGGRWKLISLGVPSYAQLGIDGHTFNDNGYAIGYTHPGGTVNGNGNKFNYYKLNIARDQVVQQVGLNGATGSKVDGLNVTMNFGGPTTRGGRHAIEGVLLQGFGGLGATDSNNADRFYVGVQGQVLTDTSDGGTSITDTRGNYFGFSAFGGVLGGGYVNNLTGGEINTQINPGVGAYAGKVVRLHTGIQIASYIGERGFDLDCALSVSNLGGSPKTWKTGLAFHGANGSPALNSDSTAIQIYPSGAPNGIDRLIDVRGVPCASLISSNNVGLSDAGLDLNAPAAFTNMGSSNVASVVRQTFRSSGLNGLYDVRLSYSGGTATAGNGILTIESQGILTNLIRPNTDNASPLGLSNFRWTVVYATTGTINTSDRKSKMDFQDVSDLVLDAWETVEYKNYRLIDEVAKLGDKAKIRSGVIAQQVIEAFRAKGLDALAYGVVEYTEWPAVPAVLDQQGIIISPAGKAGSIYGVNYGEAHSLESALMRRELKRMQATIAELKAAK